MYFIYMYQNMEKGYFQENKMLVLNPRRKYRHFYFKTAFYFKNCMNFFYMDLCNNKYISSFHFLLYFSNSLSFSGFSRFLCGREISYLILFFFFFFSVFLIFFRCKNIQKKIFFFFFLFFA